MFYFNWNVFRLGPPPGPRPGMPRMAPGKLYFNIEDPSLTPFIKFEFNLKFLKPLKFKFHLL